MIKQKSYQFFITFCLGIIIISVSALHNHNQNLYNHHQYKNSELQNHNNMIHQAKQNHQLNQKHIMTNQKRIHKQQSSLKFKNNLKNLNWYYGSITQSQYRVKLFVSATKNNLTFCPYDNPYVNQKDLTKCFNCLGDQPLFNIGKGQCQGCPQNTLFNQYLGNCTTSKNQSLGGNTNGNTSVNGTGGIQQILKEQEQKKNEQLANKNNTSSSQVTNNATSDSTNNTNTNNASSQINNAGQNETSSSNVTLPNTAVQQNGSQNANNSNQTLNQNQQKNQTSSQNINCPNDKPILEDGQCHPCPQDYQYIHYTQENQTNPLGKCIPKVYQANPDAPKYIQPSWKYIEKQNQQIRNNNLGRTIYTCPIEKPYLINGICNKCSSNNIYFSVEEKKCVDSCPQSTIYDQKLKMCVNGTFLTSPDNQNLILNLISLQDYKKSSQKEMQDRPFSEYCPKQKPFSIGNICTKCPYDKPYFNLDSQECQNCQSGRYYDRQMRKCRSSFDDSLSLDRMVMNII